MSRSVRPSGSGSLVHEITSPFGAPQFLTLSGSRLYGVNTETSDYDYIGAIAEPREYVIGLAHYKHQNGFEQYEFKGDNFEGSIYSLKKLIRMIAQGNPTILCLMFSTIAYDEFSITTPEFRSIAMSRQSGYRFIKYMEAQRKSMLGQRSKHTERLDLIDKYGYDTKFAGHLIRLGFQGIEFLETGFVTLPMRDDEQECVLQIRKGETSEADVIKLSLALQDEMEMALGKTSLPDNPDNDALNAWLVEKYEIAWSVSDNPKG